MLHIPVKDVVEKIKESTSLPEEEIRAQIKSKLESLDGLVSEEGAAYIIASELGVKLFKDVLDGALEIKNIISGMRNVEVVGKIKYDKSVIESIVKSKTAIEHAADDIKKKSAKSGEEFHNSR